MQTPYSAGDGANSYLQYPTYPSQDTLAVPNHSPKKPEPSHRSETGQSHHPFGSGLDDEDQINNDINQLARQYTGQLSEAGGNLFLEPREDYLDPYSPKFDAMRWAKAFYKVRGDSLKGTRPKLAGIAFKNLDVFGYGSSVDFQKSVGNAIFGLTHYAKKLLGVKEPRVDILHNLEGVVYPGEMIAVLGPPGSGCSTLLKSIAGDTHGFTISDQAVINYEGIRPMEMTSTFKGEAIYTAEVDDHFPHLPVGDTLYFAARARTPKSLPDNVSRREYAEHICDVTMALFGILHTKDTRVGDDFVRGVSGGERKRVTIAEATLTYAPLQCWDNSTRGLDSATALEFCRTLRMQADVMGYTSAVAIYQASQDAYDVFDKVIVLYEGRQIFFGRTSEAKEYFEQLGFVCPEQQTTADFLTSMTSHQERIYRPGFEDRAPRSADEFARAWQSSPQRAQLLEEIDRYLKEHPFGGEHYQNFVASRQAEKSNSQRTKSPYTLSYIEQIQLTSWRSWVMLKNDPTITFTLLTTNLFEGLIVSSLFYNLPPDTTSMERRALLLFFVVIINAFSSILEVLTLYAKRRIVEKQSRYAMYHRSAEALSAMIVDLPYKIVNAILLNLAVYFMCNLRREAGSFFFFLLISFFTTLSMSMMFRFIGSVTKSVAQALAPASIVLLVVALYAGFVIPPQYMQVWLGWVRWLNPAYYGVESVMVNEFIGRNFECLEYVPNGPSYDSVDPSARVCSAPGAQPGQDFVRGAAFLQTSYGYEASHKWRNFAILIALMIFFMILHLIAAEYILSERSKGEVLSFSRKAMLRLRKQNAIDTETGAIPRLNQRVSESDDESGAGMEKQTAIFHWKDVCYEVKVKDQTRRILDHVDGWVKPGTLTALMGVSGAGKTTLLDVLATRVTMGVISGDMLVNGQHRDPSFQRKTGYVQQQDLHLHTSTVREALNFSALLRQPAKYSREEKLKYVDTVISLLDMQDYSEAIVGVPGEGLNVEQRKRLTIGVELAARPQLLLFLDEPTSGLDSQTSWSICNLMEKLTNNGQAILCTIHQPSAMLFQRFDRLLLLARGGRTVYFGEIGKNSSVLVDYFTRNGAPGLAMGANPAEYMLQVIGAAQGTHTEIDWPAVWRQSPECQAVRDELTRLSSDQEKSTQAPSSNTARNEFAVGFTSQMREVTMRLFQQYWRSPQYIFSKGILSFGAALLIGLSFLNAENTQKGLQNQMFGVFLFLTIFGQVVEQIVPNFVTQRTMYEARERPSKTYSWLAFMFANIIVEMVWNSLVSIFCFICWYYPIGLYRNAYPTDAVQSRSIAMMLHVWVFFIFTGTFAHMVIAGLPNADTAGGVVNLLFIMMFAFAGILAGPNEMPRFWIFMYRINPFTYAIEGFLGTSLANSELHCADNEFVTFSVPSDQTCGEYLADYISTVGGYVANSGLSGGNGSVQCQYCAMDDTNTFLRGINVDFDNRWRNFGLMWVYCVFNIAMALAIYWLFRVPRHRKAA